MFFRSLKRTIGGSRRASQSTHFTHVKYNVLYFTWKYTENWYTIVPEKVGLI